MPLTGLSSNPRTPRLVLEMVVNERVESDGWRERECRDARGSRRAEIREVGAEFSAP
jgi:hypothetical protein